MNRIADQLKWSLAPSMTGLGEFWSPRSCLSDLPLHFHPASIRAQAIVNRPRFLDHLRLEFSGFIQGGGLVEPPDFISEI
ncbi:hypothetical protein, partial [Agrobacterium tumefaciens]|uniref:hypothetical protein n=1 Tax=Agrobacterium tumefaciens TaxID=358 RepID=UPI001BA9CBBD